MKSDHRHELKTNELADWIGHFPEWVQENRKTLIATGVVLVLVLGVYFVKFYRKDTALMRQQMRLTNLVTQLSMQAENAAMGLMQGQDLSMNFRSIANDLQDFAGTAKTGRMAAMALIERAEALRAELHYQPTEPTRESIAQQVAEAQASYREALERSGSSPSLTAAAQFGLGLCEEEIGAFDEAAKIYRQVAEDAAYVGTTAQAAAAERLKTVDDYRTEVVFKPAPKTAPLTSGLDLAPSNLLPMAVRPDSNDLSAEVPSVPDVNVWSLDEMYEPLVNEANVPMTRIPEANAPATN